jgi:hypothetical protein
MRIFFSVKVIEICFYKLFFTCQRSLAPKVFGASNLERACESACNVARHQSVVMAATREAQSIDSRLAILGAQERFADVSGQPNFGRSLICGLPELVPSLEDSNRKELQTKI